MHWNHWESTVHTFISRYVITQQAAQELEAKNKNKQKTLPLWSILWRYLRVTWSNFFECSYSGKTLFNPTLNFIMSSLCEEGTLGIPSLHRYNSVTSYPYLNLPRFIKSITYDSFQCQVYVELYSWWEPKQPSVLKNHPLAWYYWIWMYPLQSHPAVRPFS